MKFEILDQTQNVVQTIETVANPVRIGKNGSCELCLSDASVSRVHAVLEKSGNGYKLSDRMSTGGTYVNDQKVEPSKPVMISSGSVLRFGSVMVRVILDEAPEEVDDGATMAMVAPDAAALEAQAASPAPAATPSVAPAAPKASLSKAPAVTPKAAGFGGGAAFGGNTFSQSSGPATIIKKKKRPVSYERRFLSARTSSSSKAVEVAMVWHDTVLSVKTFKAENGKQVCVGANRECDFYVDAQVCGTPKVIFLSCNNGTWELMFNNSYEGFVLVGDNKTPFSEASNAVFPISRSAGQLQAGSMGHEMDGQTRAKFVFGEVSILVHSVDSVPFAAPLFGAFSLSNSGGLIASLIIHFALFSVILFATDRVDALMVDRILTTSRFAVVVEEPPVEEEQEEEQDEEEPEEEEPEEETELQKDAPDTPFAANTNSDSPSTSKTMSKAEASAAAQATGLLAQQNAMNSMLAAGMDMQNLDNLDWSSFDASAQASSAGYGLGTTGTGGGGAGLGGFGGGGFGPGGAGGTGAIRAASAGYNANLGQKGEAKPRVKMSNPEVTGSLDKRIIQKVVRQHSGELRNCYEKELAKVKGLNGRVVAVWLISPQGAVTNALVKESTIKNKNVENCVVNSIKFWRFPSPKGGGAVKIEYPFVFDLSSN